MKVSQKAGALWIDLSRWNEDDPAIGGELAGSVIGDFTNEMDALAGRV